MGFLRTIVKVVFAISLVVAIGGGILILAAFEFEALPYVAGAGLIAIMAFKLMEVMDK